MFNVGPEKILLVLLIALIVLGPHELPEAARKIGKLVRELRRMSEGFEHELRSAFDAVASHSEADRAPTADGAPAAEARAERHDSGSAA